MILTLQMVSPLPYDGCVCSDRTPIEPPQGQLRFAVPATQNFTTSVLQSFSSMFSSKLFSTGGDEINTLCYQDDAATQSALSSAKLTFEQVRIYAGCQVSSADGSEVGLIGFE